LNHSSVLEAVQSTNYNLNYPDYILCELNNEHDMLPLILEYRTISKSTLFVFLCFSAQTSEMMMIYEFLIVLYSFWLIINHKNPF